MSASVIREILKVSSRPGVISFAGGLPSPDTFPLKEFEHAVKETLRVDGTRALQYMVTEGHAGLKNYLCGWLKKNGIEATEDQMLFTQGSQQGLDLLGKIFLNPSDSILVEDPTYLGAIQCLNAYQIKYLSVSIDEDGMDPMEVDRKLRRQKAKFLYVVPTFQNPAGFTMSLEKRKGLLKVAHKYGVPIVEDDPYSVLRFKGHPVPSLYALAKGEGVIYVSTFSKILSPGIRLGFILSDKGVMEKLIYAKQATDLQTNTFIQYAVYHYCQMGYLEKHIPNIIQDYAHRAAVMMKAIKENFPSEVHYIEPEGGMFVWCRLPKGIKASEVFKKAIQKNVAFVDGSVFYPNGGGENTFRLNFTNSTDDTIQTGIERLADVIKTFLEPLPSSRGRRPKRSHEIASSLRSSQ